MATRADAGARFTLSGDSAAEKLMERVLEEFGRDISALPSAGLIRAVALGGGYGRGEGGILRRADGSVGFYNDLDFFVAAKDGASRKERAFIDSSLRAVSEKWHAELGIDVDFSASSPAASFRKAESTLMYQEFKRGHVVVFGDESAFGLLRELPFSELPLSEGARLMMNRGAGLLFAGRKFALPRSKENDDYIFRNIQKAVSGCGDAFLIARRAYEKGIPRRLALLRENGAPEELCSLYAKAAEFKASPFVPEHGTLSGIHARVLELWLGTLAAYVSPGNGCGASERAAGRSFRDPEKTVRAIFRSPASAEGNIVRNLLLNVYSTLRGNPTYLFFSHPRRGILASLYVFLLEKYAKRTYIIPGRRIYSGELWQRLWNRFN